MSGATMADTVAPTAPGEQKYGRKAQPMPQRPGCLPEGYDLDSMLTITQFAVWQQVGVQTARAALAGSMKGVLKRSREWWRIHPRTFLDMNHKK